eukprot:tig00021621_g22957.t1
MAAAPAAPAGAGTLLARCLPYLPSRLLRLQRGELEQLRHSDATVTRLTGSALFLDVKGYSKLARQMVLSDEHSAADELTSLIGGLFAELIRILHEHELDVCLFAGDALLCFVPARGAGVEALAASAHRAAAAAVALRAAAAARASGPKLAVNQCVGSGELLAYCLRGSLKAAHMAFAGDAIRQVVEGLPLAGDGDVLLSPAARELLGSRCRAHPAAGGAGHLLQFLSPEPPRAGVPLNGACACGAAAGGELLDAPGLSALDDVLPLFAPPVVREGAPSSEAFRNDIRVLFVAFFGFPELDLAAPLAAGPHAGAAGAPPPHAARFQQVVWGVQQAAADYGGLLCKVFIDDKGASSLVVWGAPNHAHEDDAARALRSALGLEAWFRQTGAPFACGLSSGRAFCGQLGTGCRREYAVLGSAVNMAARLMVVARGAVAAGELRSAVLCDESVVAAAAARPEAEVSFESRGEVELKGWAEPVAVFRARPAGERRPSAVASRSLRAVRLADGLASARGASTRRRAASILKTCYVGRERELSRIAAAVEGLAAGAGAPGPARGPRPAGSDAGRGQGAARRCWSRRRPAWASPPSSSRRALPAPPAGAAIFALRVRRTALLVARASSLEESTPLWTMRGLLSAAADTSSEAALIESLRNSGLDGWRDGPLLWRAMFAAEASSEESVAAPSYRSRNGPGSGRSNGALASLVGIRRLNRVSESLARLVRALGREGQRPVSVIVEDVHWLDSASWVCLRKIRVLCPSILLIISARPMPDPPLDYQLLAGLRDDENIVRQFNAYTASFARPGDLSSDGEGRSTPVPAPAIPQVPAEVISLAPLSEAASRLLLARVGADLAVSWLPGAVDAIVAKANGVPLYLIELVRREADGGSLTTAAGAPLGSSLRLTVPDSIQQIVLSRVDRLPEAAQAVAKLAAVAGSGFSEALLAAIAPPELQLDRAQIGEAFRDLRREGIVQPVNKLGGAKDSARSTDSRLQVLDISVEEDASVHEPGGSAKFGKGGEDGPGEDGAGEAGAGARKRLFEFSHALLQEAVYGSMPKANRRQAHFAIAEYLESSGGDALADSLIASHYIEAEACERALPALERAARKAPPPPPTPPPAKLIMSAGRGQANRTHALAEASRFCRDAVRMVDGLGLAGPPCARPRILFADDMRPLCATLLSRPPPPPRPAEEQRRWKAFRDRMLALWAAIEQGRSFFPRAHAIREQMLLPSLGEPLPASYEGRLFGFRLAVRLFRLLRRRPPMETLRAAAGAPPPAPGSAEERRELVIETLLDHGWIHLVGGSVHLITKGLHSYLRALELALTAPAVTALHGRVFAYMTSLLYLLGFRGPSMKFMGYAEEILDAFPADEQLRAAIMGQRGWNLLVLGRLRDCVESCEAAAELASRSSFFKYWESSSVGIGALSLLGRFGDVLERARLLLSEVERAGMRGMLHITTTLGWVAFFQGEDARLLETLQLASSIAARAEEPLLWWQRIGLEVLSGLYAWRVRGDIGEMARRTRTALDLWRPNARRSLAFNIYVYAAVFDFGMAMLAETEGREAAAGTRVEIGFLCCRPDLRDLGLEDEMDGVGSRRSSAWSANEVPFVPPKALPSGPLQGPPAVSLRGKAKVAPAPAPEDGPGEAAGAGHGHGERQPHAGPAYLLHAATPRAPISLKTAHALVREASSLLFSSARHTPSPILSALAALARAEQTPRGARRTAALQAARSEFQRLELRLFEAVTCMKLAREGPPGSAAHAEARAAADAIGWRPRALREASWTPASTPPGSRSSARCASLLLR